MCFEHVFVAKQCTATKKCADLQHAVHNNRLPTYIHQGVRRKPPSAVQLHNMTKGCGTSTLLQQLVAHHVPLRAG